MVNAQYPQASNQEGSMNTMKIFAMAAFISTIALGWAPTAQAANDAPPLPQQGWSQEQWAEARRIFDETNAGMTTTRQELASKREILDRELAKPNPDAGTIEKLSREIGELRGRMLSARATARSRLAERGLPADCYGPCASYYPYPGPMMGYGDWDRPHRPRHHGGHHGPRGGWGCGGMW